MVLYTCYRAEEDGHIEQSFIGYAKNEKNETILDFGNTDTFSEFFLWETSLLGSSSLAHHERCLVCYCL